MKKESKVNVTTTNNYLNFKLGIPFSWLEYLGIDKEESIVDKEQRKVTIFFKDNMLFIEKYKNKSFNELSTEEKILQIKKYEYLNGHKFQLAKDLMEDMEKYFQVSYRTIYRYLKTDVSSEELQQVQLIKKQEKLTRNISIIYQLIGNNMVSRITIPTNFGVMLLHGGKTHEELGIKSASQLCKANNFAFKVELQVDPTAQVLSVRKLQNSFGSGSSIDDLISLSV